MDSREHGWPLSIRTLRLRPSIAQLTDKRAVGMGRMRRIGVTAFVRRHTPRPPRAVQMIGRSATILRP